MIRDRDRIYGTVVTRRLRAMGILQINTQCFCCDCRDSLSDQKPLTEID
jgi:hypothetical protein